jgi:23S rRNA (pseudouridine1915-N3)-methyltransferase
VKTVIVAVGRFRAGAERALYDEYARRLRPAPELIEVEEKKKLAPRELVAREAELLLARVPAGAFVVALDGSGRTLSSEALADRLGKLRDAGTPAVCFVIGGADGLGRAVIERADFVLSLGAMTWPHMLVRTMLAEQVYRAESILAGHPYHRAGLPPGR